MLFSRGRMDQAVRDLERIRNACPDEQKALIDEAYALLVGMLRFDPHLQGIAAQTTDIRVLFCGPIFVQYVVSPLEDRYVSIRGVGRNANWVL